MGLPTAVVSRRSQEPSAPFRGDLGTSKTPGTRFLELPASKNHAKAVRFVNEMLKGTTPAPRRASVALAAMLSCFFLFRLLFGLGSEFWFPDERQIYLIGLKFFTTHAWPFFGPDVVYNNGSQIPGALQSLLVALPLFAFPVPEAPFVLLNILSFLGLVVLAVYCSRLFPGIPSWFIWTWVMTAPWAMNYSTHIINPSYVLFGSALFFVGFFELMPGLGRGVFSARLSAFLLGFALLWVFQLHLSWVLLAPFLLAVLVARLKADPKGLPALLLFFLLGCLPMFLLILPTFLEYGFAAGMGGTGGNVRFRWESLGNILTVLARFLSFGSAEITRFLGPSNAARMEFFRQHLWVVPFAAVAIAAGVCQVLWMIARFFTREPDPAFRRLRWIVLGAVAVTWLSFVFSVKGPSSHAFYVLFPLAMIYSFYSVRDLFKGKRWSRIAVLFLVCNLAVTAGIGVRNYADRSLYKDRQTAVKAIGQRNYHLLGERRTTRSGVGY
jgi:hypothetical protein